jgi:hypothetical protein
MDTPQPGYGFIICGHDDPERSHIWFSGEWLQLEVKAPFGSSASTYRKPVKIPDGMELVPAGEFETADMSFCRRETPERWEPNAIWWNLNEGRGPLRVDKQIVEHGGGLAAFIRRKPVQPTVAPITLEAAWVAHLNRVVLNGRYEEVKATFEAGFKAAKSND